MVSARVARQPHRATPRLITLGWSQFVALLAGLCNVVVVMTILTSRDLDEIAARLMAQQYERPLGFEIGLVKGVFGEPPADIWGIVRVTPGGIMDRAGLRASDYVVGTHSSFPELYGAISMAVEQVDESLAAFTTARGLSPTDPRVRTGYGYGLARAGRHAEAVTVLTTVAAESDADDIALLRLAESLLEIKRPAEALATFERLEKASPALARLAKCGAARALTEMKEIVRGAATCLEVLSDGSRHPGSAPCPCTP